MKKRIISKIIIMSMILICLFNLTIYADSELLKRGDSSKDVEYLQQLLQDSGYFNYDTITGYYGKITEDAVKAFQKTNGLKIDGITGPATWAALLSQSKTQDNGQEKALTDDETINDPDVIDETNDNGEMAYSIGMEGTDISLIQSRLIDLGFYNYDYITGYFGSITQQAVVSFQKSCSLKASGIVSKETWDKLFDSYVATSLQPGTISDSVIPLQTRLAELGYYSFGIDGNYGEKTKEAVTYFQRAEGLTANGIADEQTQKRLYAADAISEQVARRAITSKDVIDLMYNDIEPRVDDIVELAKQYLGYPYVYGASGPDEFDCNGFVAYIYDLVGISLPDSSFNKGYDSYGVKINNRLNLRPGDLVFFDTVFTDGNLADHIGIYIGDGSFIHVDESFGSRVVAIDSITKDNGWYTARFSWGRRIIDKN